MSVINRMLQDLQARRSGLPHSPGLVMAAVPRPKSMRRLGGLLLAGGSLMAIAIHAPWPVAGQAFASLPPRPLVISDAAPAPVLVASTAIASFKPKGKAQVLVHPPLAQNPAQRPTGDKVLTPEPITNTKTNTAAVDKQVIDETPRQRAQMLYREAADLAAAGHASQAIDRALESVKVDPLDADARQFAVSLLHEQQRLTEAEALARQGLAMNPQQGRLAYLLARMLSDRGQHESALALLDQQAKLGADGHGLRGGILSRSGDFKRASLDYQSAVAQQPDNSLWWLGLGVALEAQGQPQDARRVYAKAQSLGMDRADMAAFIDEKLRTLN